MMAGNNARGIRNAFYKMAVDKTRFQPEVLQTYADAAQRPGAITAMINWYRALIPHGKSVDVRSGRIDTPTLMIWGEEDSALGINCTVGTEEWVPNFELHRLPRVSHWVQQEAPEEVNRILGDWLER
jgi:pimeloyl-ACP methyl ester carboxylesterase